MSGLGRKEFNSGDILLASEVQGYLQDQAVMVFNTAAARGSAIPTPTEGMVTFRKDDDVVEVFDGSAFVAIGGGGGSLEHINTTTFGTVASQSVNDVFSATYDTYKLFFNMRTTNDTWVDFRYRAAGTDNTASNYRHRYFSISSSLSSFGEFPGTRLRIGYPSTVTLQTFEMTIMNPAQAIQTTHISQASGDNNVNAYWSASAGNLTVTTAYDGFTIFPDGGNIVGGFVSVYGVAK